MSAYDITAPARADLFDIWDYIAKDSPHAADRVINELEAAMQKLAESPGLGHRRFDIQEPDRYRFWRVYSYLVVYAPDTNPLQIIRVIHGHCDVPAVLK